jgi:hypothetical protein
MFLNLQPKCANPTCPTAFEYLRGGKFFRFRRDPVSGNAVDDSTPPPEGHHGVEHFWLCDRCCKRFILAYEPGRGVMLRLRWDELPAVPDKKELTAA